MPMLIYAAKSSPSGMTTDSCDTYLVAAAKNGDHQAYAELCRRHSQRTLRTVLRITRSIADAEDTLQESLLKAYTHIGEFDGRSAFSSWLTRIAINNALMLLRKRRSQPVYGFETDPEAADFCDSSPNAEYRCLQQEQKEILSAAMNELKPEIRRAVELRILGELSTEEVAGVMGLSVPAVKSRVLRGRRQLETIVKQLMSRRQGLHVSCKQTNSGDTVASVCS